MLFAAFTGKAALVMTRKGTPASTIHSLIYRVSEATPEEIARVEKELFDLQRALNRMQPAERTFAETQIRRLQLRLADIHKPQFLLNDQSLVRDADLIVLDEVSMVGPEMAADLLAFGKPILVLGDPGQLPPIKGAGAFTNVAPDVMLTEIHRQAEESAILRLATMARQGEPIPYGAARRPRLEDASQRGRTRPVAAGWPGDLRTQCHTHPSQRRDEAGRGLLQHSSAGRRREDHLPEEPPRPRLVNGMFVTLNDIQDIDRLCFSATLSRPRTA